MARARRNPIGLPASAGTVVVRAGTGEHTHALRYGGLLCGSGDSPDLYESDAKFITCYRCIKLLEMNAAKANPMRPVNVFSPSYDAASQEEYDAYVLSDDSKSWEHTQVQGGRRAARFSEYGPYPRDPREGGPRMEGGKIVGGKAGEVEVSDRTRQRLQPRDEEGNILPGTPPWPARTQSPNVYVQTLARMGYRIPEEALRVAHDTRLRKNPRHLKHYGKKGASEAERKLTAKISDALNEYRRSAPQGRLGLFVPPFPGPLLDAGVPTDVAWTLVRRAPMTFFASMGLTMSAQATTFGEAFVRKFGGGRVAFTPDGMVVEADRRRALGHVTKIQVSVGSRSPTLLYTEDTLRDAFGEYRRNVQRITGRFGAEDEQAFVPEILFPSIDARSRKLAKGAKGEPLFFTVSFSREKSQFVLELSSLQHFVPEPSADMEAEVRYRNLKHVSLQDLPRLLARISLRTKREGRRLKPLSIQESLENPMSYWEEQYSMSPYGAQRSVPAARRNRGRPRTSKITGKRTNLEAPKPSKWVRMTKKELQASRSPHAKRELERRAILRGDSTTKKARGRKDKVTRAKKVTTWQAFMHECRGKGMTIQQMSRAYRKLMAEKPKRKAATRKPRKTAARKTAARKTKTTSKTRVSWVNFNATGAKRGYTMKQRQSKWKQYKAGKGTIASLFPAKKTRKTASKTRKTAPKTTRRTTRAKGRKTSTRRSKTQNKGLARYQAWRRGIPEGVYTKDEIRAMWHAEKHALLNPHDYTHVREALVPAGYDYWDNSVPTAVRNPRTPRRSVPFRGARGQFSTGEGWSHGIQPVNRRNPDMTLEDIKSASRSDLIAFLKERGAYRGLSKANMAELREACIHHDPDLHEEYYNTLDNPRSNFASDPWHPVYEQMIGQFSTGLATTHGIQPSNRRNNPKKKRKGKRSRKLTAYQKFCKKHMKEGYSMAQCAQMWRNR